jgi:hypothetical protein
VSTDNLSQELKEEGNLLNVTVDDLLEAKELAGNFTLEETRRASTPSPQLTSPSH